MDRAHTLIAVGNDMPFGEPHIFMPEQKQRPKRGQYVPVESPQLMGRLIELAQQVPLPGQGRLLHHLRQGRLAEALRVCGQARLHFWRASWQRAASPEVFQARLAVLESRLQQYMMSIYPNTEF